MSTNQHHRVVIVGAGTGGISVAARLRNAQPELDIAIIDPAATHDYQPLWTLVGGGEATRESARKSQEGLIPEGVKWIQERVTGFDSDSREVSCENGTKIGYDFLVLAPGMQLDWHKVSGLEGEVGRNGICSNYSYDFVNSTWENIQNFRGKTAVFTHPATPIKCGGAPQKIMYLAADYWRKHGVLKDAEIVFGLATPTIFAVKQYANTLLKVVERYGIDVRFKHDLVAVRSGSKEAVFKHVETDEETTLKYDMLHVTPPMSAPDFIKESPFAGAGGWIDVDRGTLQHTKFPEVFSLGDASNLPTSKTGAAIRKQAPVLVENLLALMAEKPLSANYLGYTSCPLVTGYGKLVLAEFDYDLNLQETFPFDQTKERWSMYQLKKHLLPRFYWNQMLKGKS